MQKIRKLISDLSSSECKQYIDKIVGRELTEIEFDRIYALCDKFGTAFFGENDELYPACMMRERHIIAEKMFDEMGGIQINEAL